MKTTKILHSTMLGFALLLILAACSRTAPLAPDSSAPMDIEPKVRVGTIKAGMTVEQVVAELGEPQRKTANALEYTSRGFAVMPVTGIVQVVMCGDVTGVNGPLAKAFTGRTKEGIGLLSTRQEVLRAYGEPTSREQFAGGRESLRYDSLGITYSMEAGKVHHMIVRLAPPGQEPQPSIQVTQ